MEDAALRLSIIMKKFLKTVKKTIRKAATVGSIFASHSKKERQRLRVMPRYVDTHTDLPGFDFRIPDGQSFLASWNEIFEQEIYRFKARHATPRILDCGANTGLSCLFFKRQYPQSLITAFEPDPKIFTYLQHNMAAANISGIEQVPKAIWHCETTLSFYVEGADSGRIHWAPELPVIPIRTVRLLDYLNEPIDLLKIDIEGAETEVLQDAASRLDSVRNLFVEYHSFADKPQTLDQLLQILRRAGFRVQIQPIRHAAHPFIQVEKTLGMDMQLNIFAYR
jgi:FkbM family methyltransferase